MSYRTDNPNFLEFSVKMTLMIILNELCDELSHRQPEFPRILSQNDLNDIEGQGQWPQISLPAEYHSMHVWCKFGDFSWNRADKLKFADGGTDIHTQTKWRRPRQYPFGLKGQEV